MLQVTQCKVSQLIRATALSEGRAGVPFLNLRFTAFSENALVLAGFEPSAFAGSGLYALSYDGFLIYIGSYLGAGSGGAFFTGNVLNSRVWAHMGSITLRGERVHMSRRQLNKLVQQLGHEHPVVQQLTNVEDQNILHKDAGCLSPFRRMQFAAENWDAFSCSDPLNILEKFEFIYVRLTELPLNMAPFQLKTELLATEKKLIKQFAPLCNTTHVPKGAQAVLASQSDISKVLQAAVQNISMPVHSIAYGV